MTRMRDLDRKTKQAKYWSFVGFSGRRTLVRCENRVDGAQNKPTIEISSINSGHKWMLQCRPPFLSVLVFIYLLVLSFQGFKFSH